MVTIKKWQSNLIKGRIAAAHGRFNPFASPCLIAWRLVKALPRYGDFWVLNMAAAAMLNIKMFAIITPLG